MLLIVHSVHNQIKVSTDKLIVTFIRALGKGSSNQQAGTTAGATPTSGMPLQNVVLVSMDTLLKSHVFLVLPKNKYRDFLKRLLMCGVVCSLNFALKNNSRRFTSRGGTKCHIGGTCVCGTVMQRVLAFWTYLRQPILQNGSKSCGKTKNKLKWSHFCESYKSLKPVTLWRDVTW